MGDAVLVAASPCSDTMLLAQSEKCQGSGDSVPGLSLLHYLKVRKDRMSQKEAAT